MASRLITSLAVAAFVSVFAQAEPANPAVAAKHYTTATTKIGQILDDPAAKAIVDKHLPGILTGRIVLARALTLKQLQHFAPDKVSDKALASVDAEFGAAPGKP